MRSRKVVVVIAGVGVAAGVAVWVSSALVVQTHCTYREEAPTITIAARPAPPPAPVKIDPGELTRSASPIPAPATVEPEVFFPGAEETDHDESADGADYGQMKGGCVEPQSLGRRPDVTPRPPGCNDSIGVGGGGERAVCALPKLANQRGRRREAPPRERFTKDEKVSTFAVDVDTASYTFTRRCLREGSRPAPESVRVEEFVNYFGYGYPAPASEPFAVALEAAPSPFDGGKHLLRIGLQGRRITAAERKPARLTFLVDTSGSMQGPDRLGLVQRSLRLLVKNLEPTDSVAICTYAGSVREVLSPTGIEDEAAILRAIDSLTAGGSTAMASGLELAYRLADANFVPGAVNRILVCSDGDANVGPTGSEAMRALIRSHVEKGITLTTVGFGCGNYKDHLMEQLADKGNGHYVYLDSLKQARRVFQEQLAGTLQVIAKDVKVQVELDPDRVTSWRLVGYENRLLENQQFRDDKVDAGEIGSGHSVTALYELVLVPGTPGPLATVRVRHKAPDARLEDPAREQSFALSLEEVRPTFAAASADFRFAVAAAGFAEVLREDRSWSLASVHEVAAAAATSEDREELLVMLQQALRRAD